MAADLTSTPDLQALIAAVGQAWGAPDIWIAKAGQLGDHHRAHAADCDMLQATVAASPLTHPAWKDA